MKWWAFTLVLDDGTELDWQAMGKTATQALQELVNCWLARMGDAAYFLGHDLAIVECLGPLSADELAEPELASVVVTAPSSARSQDSNPASLVLDVSPLSDAGETGGAGDTSKMRRVSRPDS
jgi:hypothetical protein